MLHSTSYKRNHQPMIGQRTRHDFITHLLLSSYTRFQQAYTVIEALKAHQLRSIQQEMARSNIIDTLAESSVLITQDWAMKFLPRKYRETQADWFTNRGISWRISTVVLRKGNLQHQAFVHVAKSCNQDSDAVVRVLRHILQQL